MKWKEWIAEKKWKNLKKSDWIVLGLFGVLLLVVAAPMERAFSSKNSQTGNAGQGASYGYQNDAQQDAGSVYGAGSGADGGQTRRDGSGTSGQAGSGFGSQQTGDVSDQTGGALTGGASAGGWDPEAYAAYLEERLERVLSQMDGVGEVEVMITVADAGEVVVEKDRTGQSSVTEESDSAGGSRTVTQTQTEEKTISVENGQETRPYVQKEKLPTITGVVVVAEGAGSPSVISEISDSVMALLPVEVHRIKVVKMCSKEETK